jgi:hypothetical protein
LQILLQIAFAVGETKIMRLYSLLLTFVACFATGLASPAGVFAQAPKARPAGADSDAGRAARREILESERWQRAYQEFEDWLSVQQIYRPEELAVIRQQMRDRVATMTPQELERFLGEMEARLRVLKSPEAEDARIWLKQFMAVARNPEQQLGRPRPDVLNMTAAQIRQEIAWLEQHRASRQQAQAAFNQTRAAQTRVSRDVLEMRRDSRQPTDRSNWPANTPRTRSPYSPRRDVITTTPSPSFMIGPWGAPYIAF